MSFLEVLRPLYPKIVYLLLLSNFAVLTSGIYTKKCEHFDDQRTKGRNENILVIPKHLTHRQKEELKLKLTPWEFSSPNNCQYPQNVTLYLDPNRSCRPPKASSNPYKLEDRWKFENDEYFTDDGYFHTQGHFENPNDFCFQRVSDSEVTFTTCETDCSGDLSRTYLYSDDPAKSVGFGTSRVCIPKCCGIDETLSLSSMTCRPLNDTEPTYFLPYLHLPEPTWFLRGLEGVVPDKVLVFPQNLKSRPSFNGSHVLNSTSLSIWEHLHFSKTRIACARYDWQGVYLDDADDYGRHQRNKYNFRLAVERESALLEFLTNSRKWLPTPTPFCVDGIDGWYSENDRDRALASVVVWCAVETPEKGHPSTYKVLHLLFTIICTVPLLLGFAMYLLIYDRLSIYGEIIASHLTCVTFLYVVDVMIDISALIVYTTEGDNASKIVRYEFNGNRRISLVCAYIGVLAHYLYLSSLLWLSCLNSEAWDKLRGWSKKYWVYASVGWGVPGAFVGILYIVDILCSDPWLNLILPDYGVESCYVTSGSALYYVQIPGGIILLLNFSCILAKIPKYFTVPDIKYRTVSETELVLSEKGIPFKLFVKMCLVQLICWIIHCIEWYRLDIGQNEDVTHAVMLGLGTLLETWDLVLVHSYCLNGTVMNMVAKRVTCLEGLARWLEKRNWFASHSVACAFEPEEETPTETPKTTEEDTVVLRRKKIERNRTFNLYESQ